MLAGGMSVVGASVVFRLCLRMLIECLSSLTRSRNKLISTDQVVYAIYD